MTNTPNTPHPDAGAFAPGWYETGLENQQGYWDGMNWTEQRRPSRVLNQRGNYVEQPTEDQEQNYRRRFVRNSYIWAVVFPIVGVIRGLMLASSIRLQPVRRHAVSVIIIGVLVTGACFGIGFAIASSHQNGNVAADLRSILDSNSISYISVDGCTHSSGDQYICTVSTDEGQRTVTVTDDGNGYVYEQGLN